MAYELYSKSGMCRGKCIVCGKITDTFWGLKKRENEGNSAILESPNVGASMEIPVCNREHFDSLSKIREHLELQLRTINCTVKHFAKKTLEDKQGQVEGSK